jgi:hypothetical protein
MKISGVARLIVWLLETINLTFAESTGVIAFSDLAFK